MSEQEFERQERIGDDWLLGSSNYLDPIAYADFALADKFARGHACAVCLAHLTVKVDYLADGYIVVCPQCGEITRSNTVTNHKAELAEDNTHMGKIEIAAANAPRRTEEEIMKDMGF